MPNNMGQLRREANAVAAAIANAPIAAAGGSLLGTMSTVLQFSSQGLIREAEYQVNKATPNMILGIEPLTRLLTCGAIPKPLWDEYAGCNGVKTATRPDGPGGSWNHFLWNKWLSLSKIIPGLDTCRKFFRQGRIDETTWRDAMQTYGIYPAQWSDLLVSDWDPLSIGQAWEAYAKGVMTAEEFTSAAYINNVRPEDSARLLAALPDRPALVESLSLWNRGIIGEADAFRNMRAAGYVDGETQHNLALLRFPLPGGPDVVTTFGKLAFNEDTVTRWGLDDEKPDGYESWMAKLGLAYTAIPVLGADYGGTRPLWSDIHWRTHWSLPSIGTLAQCVQRFRGDPDIEASWSVPGVRPLDDGQIGDILAAAGVPPAMRPQVRGLLFQPLSIRHLRIGFETLDKDKDWLVGKFLDLGLRPADAADMATAYIQLKKEKLDRPDVMLATQVRKRFLRQVLLGYKLGGLTREQALAAMTTAGIKDKTALMMVNTIDMQSLQEVVSAVIKRARSDWMAGRTSQDEAYKRLLGAGVEQHRATLFVQSWEAERGEGHVVLSMGKVLSLLRKGFIGYGEAVARLTNLRVSNPDQAVLLTEVEAQINEDSAKLLRAEELRRERAIAEQEKLLRQQEALKRQLQAAMQRSTPIGDIRKWVLDGLWSPGEAAARLIAMGIDPAAVPSIIAGWEIDLASQGTPASRAREKSLKAQKALFPIAKLAKWFRDGVWSEERLRAKLLELGYPPEVIVSTIEDVKAGK